MTLSELLKGELILPGFDCASKEELINKLVELVFAENQKLPINKHELLKTIHKREQIGGTLLPSGLSVPHARLQNYEGFILAIGVPKEPLKYEGQPLRLIAMMITSISGNPYYLPVLAALTKMSRDSEYFSRLIGAKNSEDFLNILRERDAELD